MRRVILMAMAWMVACGGDELTQTAGASGAGAEPPQTGAEQSVQAAGGSGGLGSAATGGSDGSVDASSAANDAAAPAVDAAPDDTSEAGHDGGPGPDAGVAPDSGQAVDDPSPGPEDGFAAYIEAFNTGERAAVRATRVFPFLNVFGGTLALNERSEDDTTAFPGPPWDHSATESLRVIHQSATFAHVDAVYSRRDARDQVFTVGRGIYGLQNTAAGWKLRITSTVGSGQSAPPDGTAPAAADALIDAYFSALNGGDENAVTALVGYPFASIDDGEITLIQSAAAHDVGLNALRAVGWAQSRVDEVRAVVATGTAVHYAVRATCLDANSGERSTHEGLYLAVSSGGRWVLKLVSALSPLCQ